MSVLSSDCFRIQASAPANSGPDKYLTLECGLRSGAIVRLSNSTAHSASASSQVLLSWEVQSCPGSLPVAKRFLSPPFFLLPGCLAVLELVLQSANQKTEEQS